MWSWFTGPFGVEAPNTNPQGAGTFSYDLRFPGQIAGAYDALAYINPASIIENIEYAGLIRWDPASGEYYATPPESGSETQASVGCDATGNDVGLYHTHGNYSMVVDGVIVPTGDPAADDFNSDQFSPTDIEVINMLNAERALSGQSPAFSGYLGTPSGVFLQYTPGVTPPGGSILFP